MKVNNFLSLAGGGKAARQGCSLPRREGVSDLGKTTAKRRHANGFVDRSGGAWI